MKAKYNKLIWLAVVWAFGVIVLGAYVRLSDAGLGCPDWPGCYGHPTPFHASEKIQAAVADNPDGPVDMAKAWKEMIHRYLATGLGVLILVIAWIGFMRRDDLNQPAGLPLLLVPVVCFQGALGAWTVTLLLKPAIVTAHLLGGLTLLALLVWLGLRQREWSMAGEALAPFRRWARLGFVVLIAQIFLGGWVSTNYAALACPDFPLCQGRWVPPMQFGDAFHLIRELGQTPEGDMLSLENLTAIHWMHRLGALLTTLVLGSLAWRLYACGVLRSLAALLAGALGLQVVLGIANVLLQLPLTLAVAHNAGAVVLLMIMVGLNYRLGSRRAGRGFGRGFS